MRTHRGIDARSLAMAQAIAKIIDADPARSGLEKARNICNRWVAMGNAGKDNWDWQATLQLDWPHIRSVLLNPSEDGNRLRQSSPFIGILSKDERAAIYMEYAERDAAGEFPYIIKDQSADTDTKFPG